MTMTTEANLKHYPTLAPFPVGSTVRYQLGSTAVDAEVIGYDTGRVVIHILHYGNKRVAPAFLEPSGNTTKPVTASRPTRYAITWSLTGSTNRNRETIDLYTERSAAWFANYIANAFDQVRAADVVIHDISKA